MKRLLLTADTLESSPFRERLEREGMDVLHLPLETFDFSPDDELEEQLLSGMDRFRYVMHGGIRNTVHFLKWIERAEIREKISSLVHLTHRKEAAMRLEAAGIPAICPEGASRPIDLVEFLLRISGSGAAIYPVADGETEEIPGLLEEVGIDCVEMVVSKPRSLEADELSSYRETIRETPPDGILFHSRGSVIRTWTAFPELKSADLIRVAASQGASWKLAQEGDQADHQAAGSWDSAADLILSLR